MISLPLTAPYPYLRRWADKVVRVSAAHRTALVSLCGRLSLPCQQGPTMSGLVIGRAVAPFPHSLEHTVLYPCAYMRAYISCAWQQPA